MRGGFHRIGGVLDDGRLIMWNFLFENFGYIDVVVAAILLTIISAG